MLTLVHHWSDIFFFFIVWMTGCVSDTYMGKRSAIFCWETLGRDIHDNVRASYPSSLKALFSTITRNVQEGVEEHEAFEVLTWLDLCLIKHLWDELNKLV